MKEAIPNKGRGVPGRLRCVRGRGGTRWGVVQRTQPAQFNRDQKAAESIATTQTPCAYLPGQYPCCARLLLCVLSSIPAAHQASLPSDHDRRRRTKRSPASMRRVPRSSIAMAPLVSLSLLFTTAAALVAPRAAVRRTRLMAGPPIGDLADRLLSAKEKSGKTFDQIADELGFTNTYTTQLLLGQAQLKPDTLPKLKKAVPGISEADLETLQKAPFRGWDPEILKEPNVYRTYEAITHYGNAIKLLINEKFGDGIMSAIDFYMTVGGTVGKMGEKRVVITFNGKFLPFIEQVAADNSAASPEIAE